MNKHTLVYHLSNAHPDNQCNDNLCYEAADRIQDLEDALRNILEIPNSEAAAGIMKVFARAALAHKD
jgi:hypothetical protein